MEQFSRLFFLYPCRYCADFWHVSQSPAFLKAMHTKTETFLILQVKDGQMPSFTSKRILYLQEYIQPVGDLVLPYNTFRMLVRFSVYNLFSVVVSGAHVTNHFNINLFKVFITVVLLTDLYRIFVSDVRLPNLLRVFITVVYVLTFYAPPGWLSDGRV